jgi:WD40-like Beta Propeller Repeat
MPWTGNTGCGRGGGLCAVRVSRPDGDRTPGPLLDSPNSERNAAISSDGRWLAYESTQLGYPGVFVKSLPGLAGEIRVSTLDIGRLLAFDNEPSEGRSPVWSRDGRELFYINQSAMIVVPITSETAFSPGVPEQLFSGLYFYTASGPQFDVAPDGRFIMITMLENVSNELVVIQQC